MQSGNLTDQVLDAFSGRVKSDPCLVRFPPNVAQHAVPCHVVLRHVACRVARRVAHRVARVASYDGMWHHESLFVVMWRHMVGDVWRQPPKQSPQQAVIQDTDMHCHTVCECSLTLHLSLNQECDMRACWQHGALLSVQTSGFPTKHSQASRT